MYLMYMSDMVNICLEGYEFHLRIYIEDGRYKIDSHHANVPAQLSLHFNHIFPITHYYSPYVIPYARARVQRKQEIRISMRKMLKKMAEEREEVVGCSSSNKKLKSRGSSSA